MSASAARPNWFRTGRLPRIVARLSLIAILLNLFAPLGWALADQGPFGLDGALCLADADGTPAKPGPTGDHAATPHCPLCVLFGGTLWVPPADALPAGAIARVTAERLRLLVDDAVPPAPAPTLRPSPRAPPVPT